MPKQSDAPDPKDQDKDKNKPTQDNNGDDNKPDVAGDVASLKSELEGFKKKFDDSQQFIADASVILTAIGNDPKVQESVKGSIMKMYGKQPDQSQTQDQDKNKDQNQDQQDKDKQAPAPQPPVETKRIDRLEASSRNQIIEKFYNDTGLINLDQEKRATISRQIEQTLNRWGQSVMTSDPVQLPQLLQDAFVISGSKELNQEELTKIQNNQGARIPNLAGGSLAQKQEGEPELNEDQKKLAEMWGLDPNRIKERIKEQKTPGEGQLGASTLPPVKKEE